MIDLYKILPEEWFEQIGDFDTDRDKYEPIDYEPVTYALYEGNSFFGGEVVDLYADKETQRYYICSGIRQPIGDYAWETIWSWYMSTKDKWQEITRILEKEIKETHIGGNNYVNKR